MMLLLLMLIMTLMAVVEVNNMSISFSFVEIRIFDADFGASNSLSNPLSS